MPSNETGQRVASTTSALVMLVAAACTAPTAGPFSPSAQRGEALAQRICNDCHQISPNKPARSEDSGVSFMDMASAPDRNHADLMLLLTEWHTLERFDLPTTPMPTFMLTQEQREDLVSYILTFRPAVDSKQARAAD